MPVRILLVDDNQVFRSFLRRLLEKERDFSVVGEAGDGLEALEQTRAHGSRDAPGQRPRGHRAH